MNIHIVTPAGAGRRSGNRHTAQRWRDFLRGAGHRVTVASKWDGAAADLLIALHARKSSESVQAFHAAHPQRPLVVVLTGTDLYRDIRTHATARRAMALATRLVVLQEDGRRMLSRSLHAKTRVIFQSAATRVRHQPLAQRFRIGVVGHLRAEKDPFRAVMALAHLPQDCKLEIHQLGEALSPEMAQAATGWMRREPRYHWLGSRPHAETLRRMAACQLLVVSSVMEGGANVICEAGRIGLPVLASRISGNIGMLGADYPGYYRLGDEKALARLIARAAADKAYLRSLKRAVLARRALFAPASERRGLLQLVKELRPAHSAR
jgi:putative glycosyltransferase (TIGR04348 family)